MGELTAFARRRIENAQRRIAEAPVPARPMSRAMLLFISRLAPQGECLIWTGCRTGDGYGSLSVDRRVVRAHRFAYEMAFGPIPEELVIDHLCGVRSCVNPHHLEAVLPRVNWERGKGGITGDNARKTHCIRGHEFTVGNTYINPANNARVCRTCMAEHNRRWKREHRAKRLT